MGAGGRGFADDTGPVIPVACHLGDGLSVYIRNTDLADRLLASIAQAGYHGVRTWTVLHGDYWAGREIGPMHQDVYWALVEGFRNRLRHFGLRWLVSQGDLMRAMPGMSDRRSFMRRLGSLLTVEDVLGVDAGNETWQNGESDETRLQDAVDAFRAECPAPIWSLTSPQGEEANELARYAGSVGDVHSYRDGHWYDKVRHIWNNAYEGITDRPVIQSEPAGPGFRVSVTENKHELDADALHAMAIAAAMTGQMWVYFSGPGVVSDETEQLRNMPGFATTPAVLTRLPKDVAQGDYVHGGNDRRIFVASPRGDPREMRWEHTFLSDKRFVALGYGPNVRDAQTSQPQRDLDVTYDRTDSRARLVIGRTR